VLSHDGTRAYAALYDGNRISVIDTANGDQVTTIAVASPDVVTISPDGSRLYVYSDNGENELTVIDTDTNSIVGTVAGGRYVAFSPDGLRLYTHNGNGDAVSVIDIDPVSLDYGQVINAITVGQSAADMATIGNQLYISGFDSTVTVVDMTTDSVVGAIPLQVGAYNISATSDRVYATLFGSSLTVIDASTNTVIANIPLRVASGGPYVTANADGSRLYLARFDEGMVSVFDPSTNTIIATERIGTEASRTAAISQDGSVLVVPNGTTLVILSTGQSVV
jgi:YVTN family beta-propeller protein